MPTTDTHEHGLARAQDTKVEVITSPAQFDTAMLGWARQQYHILTPFSKLSAVATSHLVIPTVVLINPDKQFGEVYDNKTEDGRPGMPWLKEGEVALAKNGLRKIEDAVGISHQLVHLYVRPGHYYWHVKAIGTYKDLTGEVKTKEASAEWDLTDGSPRLKGFSGNQINEARKHGLRNCETRAVSAMIREVCGLRQKYRKEELERPFVAVRVVYQPDMTNPEVLRLVTERALGSTATLYPGAPTSPAVLPAGEFTEDDEIHPRQVGSGATAAVGGQAARQDGARGQGSQPSTDGGRGAQEGSQGRGEGQQRQPEAPPIPEGYGLLQGVPLREMKQRRDKTGDFPKWTVVDHEGVHHVTIKRDFGATLERVYAQHIAVRIASEENSYQELDITEILEHDPRQGRLPGTDRL